MLNVCSFSFCYIFCIKNCNKCAPDYTTIAGYVMASFRVYKKKIGYSVTAVVRKKGIPTITETFTAETKAKAMKEAEAWAGDIERDAYLVQKKNPEAAKQRLSDFFDKYFEHVGLTNRKKKTTIAYERWSRTQIERIIGADTYLTDITTAMVAAYRDKRITEGIGASKIRSEMALISCLFKFAIQERGYNIKNPVGSGKIWRPAAPRGKIDFLTEEEIKRLLDECRKTKNKKLAAYVSVLINTGMRPGEAALLKVRDVDQERKSISLEETKNNESRLIPLTETACREIMPLVANRRPDEYVFYSGEITPYLISKPASMFKEAFDSAKRRAGLDRITRHGMRHTAATHMLKNNIPLRVIAEVLGHKTLQMVMRYTHPDEEELRKAVNTLDGLI